MRRIKSSFQLDLQGEFKLGVVGSEAAKFTSKSEAKAKQVIRDLVKKYKATTLVSGGCHLGGVDIHAEEVAAELGLKMVVFAPKVLQWNPPGKYGYRARNLDIAKSDLVACITVDRLPSTYTGMRFDRCMHCEKYNPEFSNNHVKSGGCWTAWNCKRQEIIIVEQEE